MIRGSSFTAETQRRKEKPSVLSTSLRLCGLILFAGLATAQTPDCTVMPGWKQQGPARSYTAENLFEYMDGNAEGFVVYRLVKMDGVNCESAAGTLVFDVFEMADPEWAYGVFASNRDPREPSEKIGAAGQVVPRQAIFAKDKYFVQIAADKEQPDLLRQLALAFAQRIPGRSEPPEALSWFPPEKLEANLIRMVPESVLGFRLLKRGYVAQYPYGKAFLVPEDTPESAAAVMQKFRERLGGTRPAAIGDEGFEVTDKYLGRIVAFRKGRYIGGFTGIQEGTDGRAEAKALAGRVK
jgi:hypothetical protein